MVVVTAIHCGGAGALPGNVTLLVKATLTAHASSNKVKRDGNVMRTNTETTTTIQKRRRKKKWRKYTLRPPSASSLPSSFLKGETNFVTLSGAETPPCTSAAQEGAVRAAKHGHASKCKQTMPPLSLCHSLSFSCTLPMAFKVFALTRLVPLLSVCHAKRHCVQSAPLKATGVQWWRW